MADTILGLLTSAKFLEQGDRFLNHRRNILYSYPQGNCPLTGILSMCEDDPVSDSQTIWYEERWQSPQFKTRGTDPLTKTAPSTGDANDGTAADTAALALNTDLYLKVDTTRDLRPGYIIQNNLTDFQFWVSRVVPGVTSPASSGYVVCRVLRPGTFTAAHYTAGNGFACIGTAIGEGASDTGITPVGMRRPYPVTNQTQIFRTPFTFSGTVLKEGLKYDDTGPYKKVAKARVIEHMTSIERQLLWGQKSTITRPSLTSGDDDEVVRTMSGITEFLRLWDAGSTGLTVDGVNYAPYGFKDPSLTDADDGKRIITNADGILSVKRFNTWAERVTRYGNGKTRDKLILCGSAAALVFSEMLRKNTVVLASEKTRIYGLQLTTISTPVGDFHLMTHPLFNERADLRNQALILDVWNLKFRPLTDRDTKLRKMIQANGADRRKDEFLTEATLEMHRPDTCMWIKNITSYSEQ